MTLEEYKQQLEKAKITVEWDAGHAYHTDDGPTPDDCDDPDAAYDFQSDWYDDRGSTLFCVPRVLEDILAKNKVEHGVVSDECCDDYCQTVEDQKEYLSGFADLADEMGKGEWYRTDLLREYIKSL